MKHTRRTDLSLTVTYGREGPPTAQIKKVGQLAGRHQARSVFVIDPPEEPGSPGWRAIATAYEEPFTPAEGGILTGVRESLLISSRDCPIVVVENLASGHVGAVHAGRESLISRHSPCCASSGIVEQLLGKLRIADGARTRAYITAGISGRRFVHDEWRWVRPFVKEYGPNVIVDYEEYALDIIAVITAKLARYGIKDVRHDGLCTVDTPWLGSRRAGKAGANWVFVMKTR